MRYDIIAIFDRQLSHLFHDAVFDDAVFDNAHFDIKLLMRAPAIPSSMR
jgi:hypothetical protein